MLKHLDLFSGIGGFSLGLESAGLVETVAFCDFDKYCQKVLKKNFPSVPVYGDVKELNYDKLKADGIDQIDIITGGYPCQPFSVAGRKKGEDDPRHVWPEMFRLIKELRPTWVIGENVGGHIKLGLDTVLENLESEGYSARTFSISATSIGANHKRERVWIIANLADTERLGRTEGTQKSEELKREESSDKPDNCGQRCTECQSCQTVANSDEMQRQYLRGQESEQTQKTFERISERSRTQNGVANSEGSERNVDDPNGGNGKTSQEELSREYGSACGVGTWWSVEPDVGRVAHGVPDRVDRLKCLGNSVVPQIPYVIGLSLKKIIENNE
jgi:DNA (cytosine-5)-methyltransferase 1